MAPNADRSAASTRPETVPLIIGDKEIAEEAAALPVINPETGEVVHRYHSASAAEAALAVRAAHAAFPAWSGTAPKARRDMFLRAADIMDRRRDELGGYMKTETASRPDWIGFNVNTTIDLVRHAAALTMKANVGAAPVTDRPDTVGALVLQDPYGVVVGIAPWNAPYVLGMRALLFPLAAGNTVILKGSELSPRCMWALVSVLREAGVPAGAVNVLYSAPAAAEAVTRALVGSPEVRKINFTGSAKVGSILSQMAGEYLKPLLLELGGKASAIVWADADLDLAAQQCAAGAFLNAGQTCMATERVVVHRDVRAAFEAKLRAATVAMFGDAQDASAGLVMAQKEAAAKVYRMLADATGGGARIVGPDAHIKAPHPGRVLPTIVSGVAEHMDMYRTESFGPIVGIVEVGTEEEALRVANDTEYGLAAAVFTDDLRRGLRMARAIHAGAVHINSMTVHDEMGLPHGGTKSSGYGRFNTDLTEWTQTKTITYQM